MKKVFLLLVLLLLFVPFVAGDDAVIANDCSSVSAFDYESQIICLLHSQILSENKLVIDENNKLMDEAKDATLTDFLKQNNDKKNNIYKLIYAITAALFVFVAVYTGYMYISSATYPEKREMAKVQLKSLVFIAIAIVASQPIIVYVNEIADLTTSYVYNNYFEKDNFVMVEPSSYEGTTDYERDLDKNSYLASVSPTFQLAARSYIMSMRGRDIILISLMAMFPLIILMFFFHPTQEFGKFLVTLYLLEAFLPVLFTVILAISTSLLSQTSGIASMQIITSALFFAAFMHVVLVLLAIIKSAISAMYARRYLTSGGG